MLNICLFNPEIPQNTGNIARTCAVTGTHLTLVRPLGFDISEKSVRHAGLDYWDKVKISVYDTIDESLPGLLFLGWGGEAYRGYAVGAEGLYLQDRKAGVDQTALTGVEVLHRFVGI